jgi:basic amino acid/polyamine antiporter, APA family
VNSDNTQESKLKPVLGLLDATAINVGAIVGAGIFIVTGIAAGVAGSAMIVSMLIGSVVALFTALSFAELTAWLPKEGSVYEFAYQLVSPFVGFLSGWMWILSNTFAGAAVSLGFAYYFTALFPIIPTNWLAAIICICFTVLNFIGTRKSALLNNFLVATKILILMFFFIFGLGYINLSNFTPFEPLQVGVLYGAYYMFFAYGGFARVAVVAEEIKDAKRNVPRAILISLGVSAAIYILVGIVAIGLVGAPTLSNSNSPLIEAMSTTGSATAVYIISLGGLIATASVLLTSILGVSRVAYAMSRRRDLPQTFAKLHPKFNTPYYSVWILGILMAFLVLFLDLTKVVAISTFSTLFYYCIANIAALRLREQNRLYPSIVPILGIATCLVFIVFIFFVSPQSLDLGIAVLVGGTIYYVAKMLSRRAHPQNEDVKDSVAGNKLMT